MVSQHLQRGDKIDLLLSSSQSDDWFVLDREVVIPKPDVSAILVLLPSLRPPKSHRSHPPPNASLPATKGVGQERRPRPSPGPSGNSSAFVMAPTVDLRIISRREAERTGWNEKVSDLDDLVATLSAFANDLQNLGGGYVVCGAREAQGADGFSILVRSSLSVARLREVEGTVLNRCREQVSPPIAPLIEELPSDDPDRRLLILTQPATGHAHTYRRRGERAKHFVRVGSSTLEARNGLLLELLVRKGDLEPWDRRPCLGATAGDLDLLVLRGPPANGPLPAGWTAASSPTLSPG